MQIEHIDQALAEEFAGHGETIHKLKVADPNFKALMAKNHELWAQIQNIQKGLTPTSDATLETLEKQRLALLDDIGARIAKAEA